MSILVPKLRNALLIPIISSPPPPRQGTLPRTQAHSNVGLWGRSPRLECVFEQYLLALNICRTSHTRPDFKNIWEFKTINIFLFMCPTTVQQMLCLTWTEDWLINKVLIDLMQWNHGGMFLPRSDTFLENNHYLAGKSSSEI